MPELGFVFLAGLILRFLYWKTKSLVAPIVTHGGKQCDVGGGAAVLAGLRI